MDKVEISQRSLEVILRQAEQADNGTPESRMAIGDARYALYGNEQVEGQLSLW